MRRRNDLPMLRISTDANLQLSTAAVMSLCEVNDVIIFAVQMVVGEHTPVVITILPMGADKL